MKAELWNHDDVNDAGECSSGGAVHVNGAITFSHPTGGCSLERCNCSEGHWICLAFPRTADGVVAGVTVHFDNRIQMMKFVDDMGAASAEYCEIGSGGHE